MEVSDFSQKYEKNTFLNWNRILDKIVKEGVENKQTFYINATKKDYFIKKGVIE